MAASGKKSVLLSSLADYGDDSEPDSEPEPEPEEPGNTLYVYSLFVLLKSGWKTP